MLFLVELCDAQGQNPCHPEQKRRQINVLKGALAVELRGAQGHKVLPFLHDHFNMAETGDIE